jgi:ABC-type sugar transport system substrate-binding protein
LALALAVGLATGCGPEPGADAKSIALVLKTRNNPFFIEMEKAAREAAAKRGVRLLVSAADDDADVERQLEILETLLVRRVGAIAVTPCGSKAVVPWVRRANRANVPVLAVDTKVDPETLVRFGAHVETFIGSDNFEGGRLAGEYLGRLLDGKGEVAVIEGLAGHETGDARKNGFLTGIGKYPGIKVAASQTGEWDQEKAYNATQSILLAHPEVRGIFAANDRMAMGALSFVGKESSPYRDKVKIVGFDASDDARAAIAAGGPMVASVAQFPGEMGRLAVERALNVMGGRSGTLPPVIPTKVELVKR